MTHHRHCVCEDCRPVRSVIGRDLDAVPVANATERTAPTWEARALAAEARLAAVEAEVKRLRARVGSEVAPDPEFVTLAEAARDFHCHVKTLRRRIAAGDLTAYRFGGRVIRVKRSDLARLLRPISTSGQP